jgi:hypothetical protein
MSSRQLLQILVNFRNTATQKAKIHSYYVPKINVHSDQSTESIIKELKKIEIFFRNPELSYLNVKPNK